MFTCKKEVNKTLPYLLITRRNDGHLPFSVHRKPKHTNIYLFSKSYHPLSHKIVTALTLFHCVTNNYSIEHEQKEINTILKYLKINGYAENLIKNCHRGTAGQKKNNRNINLDTETFGYILVLYFRRASDQVGKILHAHGINLRHKQAHTLRSELCTVKDKTRGYGQEWRDILYISL